MPELKIYLKGGACIEVTVDSWVWCRHANGISYHMNNPHPSVPYLNETEIVAITEW